MTTVVKTSLKNNNLWAFKLYRVYLNPLISSNPGVEFLRTLPRFKKRGDMYMKYSRMFTSFINHRIRRFHVVVVQWTSNWNLLKKKTWCTCKPVVLLIKPIVFWRCRCRRRGGCLSFQFSYLKTDVSIISCLLFPLINILGRYLTCM